MIKITFNSRHNKTWEARIKGELHQVMADAIRKGYVIAEEAYSLGEEYWYIEQPTSPNTIAIPFHNIYKMYEA